MQKTIIALVILVLVAAGAYVLITKDIKTDGISTAPIENLANEEVQGENENMPAGKKMAFSQFIKQGGSYKCDVKQYMSDFENSGTVYLNDGKIRGEFSTVAEGRTLDTTIIVRDGYAYTWSSILPNSGFKTKVSTDVSASTGTYEWNADQIGDYNCEVWAAEETKFTVPTGVTFKEVASQ